MCALMMVCIYSCMRSMENEVIRLLSDSFGIVIDFEQAAYIVSMKDPADVREWLMDAHGLEDVDEFISALFGNVDVRTVHARPVNIAQVISGAEQANTARPAPTVTKRVEMAPPVRRTLPLADPCRRACNCLASEHALLGNCLNCGKIVCKMEDYGPCLFCKEPVDGRMFWNGFDDVITNDSLTAIEQKNRLIQYDREGAQRTRVFDDSTDWFAEASDVWKSAEERAIAQKLGNEYELAKLEAKREMKIDIDFSSGTVSVLDKRTTQVEQANDEKIQTWIAQPSHTVADTITQHADTMTQHTDTMTQHTDTIPRIHGEPISLFSFLDDEANEALDALK